MKHQGVLSLSGFLSLEKVARKYHPKKTIALTFPTKSGRLKWSKTTLPAEVVVAQAETAGVWFPGCEPPSSQSCGVPVDTLCPRVADAPCATIAFTPTHNALLSRVCQIKIVFKKSALLDVMPNISSDLLQK